MNLRSLEYLVALAEHRHFGRAAEACFVSQPTLSAQIRKLEQELGAELVERNPAGVLMTPAGEEIVVRARRMLDDADNIRHIGRLHRDPDAAVVRLGVFPTLAPYLLPHVMPTVRTQLPRLQLMLVEEKSDVLLDRLHDGRLDVAVLAAPIDAHGLHEDVLFDEDFVIATPHDERWSARLGEELSTADLAGENILLLDEGHCLRDQALSVCRLAGADERNGFRATSLETLRQMVASGVGITLLPRLAVSAPVPASPDIDVFEITAPTPNRRIAMYWRASSPFAAFLPRLAEAFRTLPDTLVHPIPPD
ncbi:MAG: LysR substrate-binding domain-containing protein [Ilumatobacteraceae bacterium]